MEDNEFDETFENMTVDYNRIAQSSTMLAVTRLLAMSMLNDSYITVGKFLAELSDQDLVLLQEISEDDTHPHFEEIVLISLMLAAGEGIDGMALDDVTKRVNLFTTLLVIESLHRRKLVIFHRENASLGDDAGSKVIVEKIK